MERNVKKFHMDNAFIKKIYIEKDVTEGEKNEEQKFARKVVFSTNERLLVGGKYRDVAYAYDKNDDVVTGIVDITGKEITVDCKEMYSSLLTLRDEHINVTMSESGNSDAGLVVERIELSNE